MSNINVRNSRTYLEFLGDYEMESIEMKNGDELNGEAIMRLLIDGERYEMSVNMKNGKKEGVGEILREDGTLFMRMMFVNDECEGEVTKRNENGSVVLKGRVSKEKGSGLAHLGEKERKFWIEYTGVVKIGIEMSDVKMDVNGTSVQITIPRAKIFQPEVKTIDVDDYIATSDSWFNQNQITAEEQTQAVNEAQDEMVAAVEKNKTLLAGAQERAKTLIENYITQLGEATGVEYQVTWKYAENGTER